MNYPSSIERIDQNVSGFPIDHPEPTGQNPDGLTGQASMNQPAGSLSGLARIPFELAREIASFLPAEDLFALSDSSECVRNPLKNDRLAVKLTASAGQATTLQEVTIHLTAINELPGSLRVRPLAALAGRISQLPEDERQKAFEDMFDVVGSLAKRDRIEPLAALAGQVVSLKKNVGSQAFIAVFDAIRSLPRENRGEPLARLASGIAIPTNRTTAFQAVLAEARYLPDEHRCNSLAALARVIHWLRPAVRAKAFEGVVDAIMRLREEHRSVPLLALAGRIMYVPEADRLGMFRRMLAAVASLPREHRGTPLAKLYGEISDLPENDRDAAIDAVRAFLRANS